MICIRLPYFLGENVSLIYFSSPHETQDIAIVVAAAIFEINFLYSCSRTNSGYHQYAVPQSYGGTDSMAFDTQ